MPIKNSRPMPKRSQLTVRSSGANQRNVPMARAGNIPAGHYRSTIMKISSTKTAAGEDAVEVIYELVSPKGHRWRMREVLPVDGWPFEKFGDALIAAGLHEGDDLICAVGVAEDVELAYPNPRGLGHFATRTPAVMPSEDSESASAASPDTQPFLEDEDDDEEWEDY